MRRKLLDTNILIAHWQKKRHAAPQATAGDAREWAKELVDIRRSNVTVTPVVLEFLAGVRPGELALLQAFLAEFDVIDKGRIPADDWEKAKQFAQRIPAQGQRRLDFADCLIKAIGERLHLGIDTFDRGF